VPELGADAVGASVHLPVENQSSSDTGAQGDAYDDGLSAGRAEAVLGPGGGIGVVLDRHRDPDPFAQCVPKRLVAPGQVRREEDGGPVGADPARRADADGGHLVAAGEHVDDLGDHRLGFVHVMAGRAAQLGVDDRTLLVHHTAEHLATADVDPDGQSHASGLVVGSVQHDALDAGRLGRIRARRGGRFEHRPHGRHHRRDDIHGAVGELGMVATQHGDQPAHRAVDALRGAGGDLMLLGHARHPLLGVGDQAGELISQR
jgi:hypothetical protein